jgi:hypothetical protein
MCQTCSGWTIEQRTAFMEEGSMLRIALIVLSLVAVVPAAQAQRSELVDGDSTRSILDIARGFGSADMDRRGDKDPAISGRMEGLKYSVLFSGCQRGRDCKFIQLIASFELPKGYSDRDMNDWNKKRLFGKAFINDNRDAVISMNFTVYGGVTRANFSENMAQFKVFLREFNEFLYGKRRR